MSALLVTMSDAETEGGTESDCDSGPIKLPNLYAFASRPVIEERTVALGKLKKISRILKILKRFGLTWDLHVPGEGKLDPCSGVLCGNKSVQR